MQRPERPQRPARQRHVRRTRRQRVHPASVALAVVGIALFLGFVLILTGGTPRPMELRPHETPPTDDPDSHLRAKIEALKSTSRPPAEARRMADDLYDKATRRETQDEIKLLVLKYAKLEAEEHRTRLKALEPQVMALAGEGKFRAAPMKVAEFEEAHELMLSRKLSVVKVLREEIASLYAAIDVKRKDRFVIDLERLKRTVKENDLNAASDVVGAIYAYADPAMKAQADAVWGPLFRRPSTMPTCSAGSSAGIRSASTPNMRI